MKSDTVAGASAPVHRGAQALSIPLYGSTILLAAGLIFWIEPLFTKTILPLLGGSPGVWNTALMFFQAALLAGYLYAHVGTRLLGVKRHAVLHLTLVSGVLLLLPPDTSPAWTPPVASLPVPWLLGVFAVSIGLPFFVLAATSPLLQTWFASTGHPSKDDPYFLYAASNAGSLLALLAFPFLLEPAFGLERQSRLWTAAYWLFAALTAFLAMRLFRAPTPSSPGAEPPLLAGSGELPWKRRARWLLLAFAPSSLLLGVTAHVSTDVASVPLLWVVPLSLYLLTFILAFGRRTRIPRGALLKVEAMLLVLLAVALPYRLPLSLGFALHLLAFFLVALTCHDELARDRPAARHLTEFYLWISVGGALGGAFNVLVAPLLFDRVLEYPLVLMLACLLRPAADRTTRRSDLALPVILVAAALFAVLGGESMPADWRLYGGAAALAVVGLGAYALRGRPAGFAVGVGAVLLVSTAVLHGGSRVLLRERSFFGVHTVRLDPTGRYHLLTHGTTIHGAQRRAGPSSQEPRTYYGEDGPLGDVLVRAGGIVPAEGRVGVVGLGAGSVACHARDGQRWTFFEIDPVVVRLATKSPYFSFLEDCGGEEEIVLGDARLSLRDQPAGRFDVLIVDAFTSDAVPVHLLTREALELYLSRLRAGGLVALHLSNRHMDLEPVVAAGVHRAGATGVVRRYTPPDSLRERLHSPSLWAVFGRDDEVLRRVATTHRDWSPLHERPGVRGWTDDYSNILDVLDWEAR